MTIRRTSSASADTTRSASRRTSGRWAPSFACANVSTASAVTTDRSIDEGGRSNDPSSVLARSNRSLVSRVSPSAASTIRTSATRSSSGDRSRPAASSAVARIAASGVRIRERLPEFSTRIPTTENLAIAIWQRLVSKLNKRQAASRAGV